MFGGMKGKLQAMQQQVEEIKKRLDTITVYGEAEGVRVTVTGNREVVSTEIPDAVLLDKETTQDLVLTATNRALDQANRINESEMAASAASIMPNIPGFK